MRDDDDDKPTIDPETLRWMLRHYDQARQNADDAQHFKARTARQAALMRQARWHLAMGWFLLAQAANDDEEALD